MAENGVVRKREKLPEAEALPAELRVEVCALEDVEICRLVAVKRQAGCVEYAVRFGLPIVDDVGVGQRAAFDKVQADVVRRESVDHHLQRGRVRRVAVALASSGDA